MAAPHRAATRAEEAGDLASLARRIAASPPGAASDAEERLTRLLARRVWLYGMRHLRQEDAANDLVQQVMTTTLEQLRAGRVREPERLASFVLGTSRNVVRDLRRAERRRRELLERWGPATSPTVEPAPALDRERLDDCIERLPERDRTVVALTFYAERSSNEIAAELTLSPANVRVVRHRALARLRDCIEPGGTR